MSKIIHKKSSVVGKVPLPADLDYGELAINYAEGYLYYKTSAGAVERIKAGDSSGWQLKTANYTAISGDKLLTNTSAGSFTITLPASPAVGTSIVIADAANWETNPVTLARNGSTIEGLAENLSLDVAGADATLVYDGATWQVFSSIALGNLPADLSTATGTLALAKGGTGSTTASGARTNLGLAIGSNVQAWDADLDAIAALSGTNGFLKKTNTNTWQLDTTDYLTSSSSLNAANLTGTIDPARLPSYVDDVLEFANLASLPATGEAGKIYVALDTNKVYRWSGSTYIEIVSSPDLSGYLTLTGGTLTGNVTLNAQSDLRFADADSSNWVAFQAPAAVVSNITWTLPATDGTANQVLTTNGSGALSWSTATTSTATSSTYGTVFGNTVFYGNTSLGGLAMQNVTGTGNTAVGGLAYRAEGGSTGTNNTIIGYFSATNLGTGSSNATLGTSAGQSLSTGSQNTLLGASAGFSGTNDLTTGSNNIIIGYNAAASSATVSNETTIGNSSTTSARIFGDLKFQKSYTESVFTITDGVSVDINPSNGTIQLWTLGANRTPTATNFNAGQSVTLMIDDGSGFAITWSTIGVVWVGGSAPALATTGRTVIELWEVGTTIYGAVVGSVA